MKRFFIDKNVNKKRNMLCDKLNFILHEEYRTLRTNIIFSLTDEKKYHCIGITSAIKAEGKSTTAINLAYVLAEKGEKVCILEADMHIPSLRKKLNIFSHVGLSEYLTSQANANDCLEKISFKECSFHCIQAGTLPPNPAELLSSSKMEKLLSALGEVFTYIIVDLPPVTMVSDAVILGEKLDGVVMVVSEDVCTKSLLKESMRSLSMGKIKLLGFVRTFTKQSGFGYGKYGKYYEYSDKNDKRKT